MFNHELPPVVSILLDEGIIGEQSIEALAQRLKASGVVDELAEQARWTFKHFQYDPEQQGPTAGRFIVVPSGVLNPLTSQGKCTTVECRLDAADNFARSVGLYADGAIVPDPFTAIFSDTELASDPYHFSQHLFHELKVLERIMPLVDAKFVRFSQPARRQCKECHTRSAYQLRAAAGKLVARVDRARVFVEMLPGEPKRVKITEPFSPDEDDPLSAPYVLTESEVQAFAGVVGPQRIGDLSSGLVEMCLEKIARRVEKDLRHVSFDIASADEQRAVLLTGSRAEALYLKALDSVDERPIESASWESLRMVDIPWVHDLSPGQVVALRERASKALPRLRTLLSERLCMPNADGSLASIVSELREQAVEVGAELSDLAKKKRDGRTYEVGLGSLGLSLVIYGLMSQAPTATVTGVGVLIRTLQHLKEREESKAEKARELISRPAYAVLQAKQLFAPANNSRVRRLPVCGPQPPHGRTRGPEKTF